MSLVVEQIGSRRVPGVSRHGNGPCVVVDVLLRGLSPATFADVWYAAVEPMLAPLHWQKNVLSHRPFEGGLSLVMTAPLDGLYAGLELAEWGLAAARAWILGGTFEEPEVMLERLRAAIAAERRPALLALGAAAAQHGVAFIFDADAVSVGVGAGARVFQHDDIPPPDDLDWHRIHDIPVALVSGSRGAAVTARLLAAVATAAGLEVGLAAAGIVEVAGARACHDDGLCPAGARTVLRDPRARLVVLQVGRAALLRRGLPGCMATAVALTDIDETAAGFSFGTVEDLVGLKLLVARCLGPSGRLVWNADDRHLAAHADRFPRPSVVCTRAPGRRAIPAHLRRGGGAVFVHEQDIIVALGGRTGTVVDLTSVPWTLNGAAGFAVVNSLCAIGLAAAMNLPLEAMREGLRSFDPGLDGQPWGNLWRFGTMTIALECAADPAGLARLAATVLHAPDGRRSVLLAADAWADQEARAQILRTLSDIQPDHVLVSDHAGAANGDRPPSMVRSKATHGATPEVLREQLQRHGLVVHCARTAHGLVDAVLDSLASARQGDLLLVLCRLDHEALRAVLDELRERGWQPGAHL